MKRLTIPKNGVRALTPLKNKPCVDDSCNSICDAVDGDCLKCPISKALGGVGRHAIEYIKPCLTAGANLPLVLAAKGRFIWE